MRKRKLLLPLDDDTVRRALARRRRAIRAASLRDLPAAADRHAVDATAFAAIEEKGFDDEDPVHILALQSFARSQRRVCRLLRGAVGDKLGSGPFEVEPQVAGVDLGDRIVLLIATPVIDVPVATAQISRPDGDEREIELRIASLPASSIVRMSDG